MVMKASVDTPFTGSKDCVQLGVFALRPQAMENKWLKMGEGLDVLDELV